MIRLSPVLPDPIPGQQPALPLPLTLVDGEEEYEVEAILDSQMCYNCLKYLVKWKGYNKSHNQWEVYTQVHAKPKIAQFHHKYPGAACHINATIFNSIPFTRADLATSWKSLCVMTLHFEEGVMSGDICPFPYISSPFLLSPSSPPVYMYTPHTSAPSPGTTLKGR
jgi:hypothetical protein